LSGEQIAEYGNATTYFIHKDQLGSTRLMTDINGNDYDLLDFLPFGEQAASDTGTTPKFTGKERDSETNFDNFGARYFTSAYGRFISPDEPLADEDTSDPQSWKPMTNGGTTTEPAMAATRPEWTPLAKSLPKRLLWASAKTRPTCSCSSQMAEA